MSFNCGGGTAHVNYAERNRVVYNNQNFRFSEYNVIGWNGKTGAESEVAGVDVPVAQLRESYTKIMRVEKLRDTSYKRKVASLVGCVNNSTFKGWDKGEVMFLGLSYSTPLRGQKRVNATYNFAIQTNETNAIVCGYNIREKYGWEYVWVINHNPDSRIESKSNDAGVSVHAIIVSQPFKFKDFSVLGI